MRELKKAAKSFNVPRSTVKDNVKKSERGNKNRVLGSLGRKPVLPHELENELSSFA